jgi:hypothetical protein
MLTICAPILGIILPSCHSCWHDPTLSGKQKERRPYPVVLSVDPVTGLGSADVPSANAPGRLGPVRIGVTRPQQSAIDALNSAKPRPTGCGAAVSCYYQNLITACA